MANMAYIAKCKCGGIVMAIVDDLKPQRRKDIAKEIASCVKDDFEIGRITCEEVRTTKWCKNHGKCQGNEAENA